MTRPKAVIIGAGGHGRVVLDVLRAGGRFEPAGFLDDGAPPSAQGPCGLPVLGPVGADGFARLLDRDVRHFVVAIGDNAARLAAQSAAAAAGLEPVNAVHPTAFVSPAASLGRGVVVCPNAAVVTGARLGDACVVNTAAVVDHECDLAEGVHVAPGALLAGRVTVGRLAFVGIGARVIQGIAVGERATVGAGAVVIENVPAGATVVGVPARVVKTLG
jgi:sugar O-acyltransferase (sialic acid O-acetyltransferase NeuD family)